MIHMTQRQTSLLMVPFQGYCAAALLGLVACRALYGHEVHAPLIMFLAWSCIASSFLWLIGAAIQAHFRFIGRACLNAALAMLALFFAAELVPYLAR
jgi:hypothetical protein